MKDSLFGRLSWTFASKYRITLLIWVIFLVFGFFSYTTFLGREGFPPINLPIGAVQGTYFADNPAKVDAEVTSKITDSFQSLDSIKKFQTASGPNFYTVFVTFNDDVDVDQGIQDLEAAIGTADLPDSTSPTVSSFDPSKFDNKYNLLLAVYDQQDSDYQDLYSRATQVATKLQARNEIQSASAVPVVEQVTNPANGQKIERQTSINTIGVKEDGQINYYPAISIGVVKSDSIDAIELSKATSEVLESKNLVEASAGSAADTTRTTITADFAKTINSQISSLESSLKGGLIAVIIVALLLISWRAALVIALFIPTVLALSFLSLNLLGITLNTITLFATILTLGLFVDDATIIVEAIDAHRRDSKDHKTIIKTAIKRVGIASLAGTLTTILVFTPMLYVSGILGSFITLLPITVILALTISFITSIILVPFLSRILVLSSGKGKADKMLDKLSLLVPVERVIANGLSKLPLLNKKDKKKGRIVTTIMVGISLLAILGAGVLSSRLPLDIFPQSKDSDILLASVEFAPGTPIEKANTITQQINKNIVKGVGENLTYVTYTGADNRQASIEIGLTPFGERELTSHDIIDQLNDTGLEISGASIKYGQQDSGPPSEDFPFQMRVYAPNEDLLSQSSKAIADYIEDQSFQISGKTVQVKEVETDIDGTIRTSEKGRYVTILANFDDSNLTSAAVINLQDNVQSKFDKDKLESIGLTTDALDFDVSQESENAESFNSIGVGLVVALIGMYVLLVILFNSFSQPLLIFMAIPFSLFGVFLGLTLTDNSFSFFVMLGLLGLIGIVVNNTILLTEYANQERDNGADRHQAISEAVKDRFRPLVTTTLTTVFALLPLALSDPFWQALAYTLIFGMISSTTLIIISFPYYYLLFERIRDWKNKKIPSLR